MFSCSKASRIFFISSLAISWWVSTKQFLNNLTQHWYCDENVCCFQCRVCSAVLFVTSMQKLVSVAIRGKDKRLNTAANFWRREKGRVSQISFVRTLTFILISEEKIRISEFKNFLTKSQWLGSLPPSIAAVVPNQGCSHSPGWKPVIYTKKLSTSYRTDELKINKLRCTQLTHPKWVVFKNFVTKSTSVRNACAVCSSVFTCGYLQFITYCCKIASNFRQLSLDGSWPERGQMLIDDRRTRPRPVWKSKAKICQQGTSRCC